MREYDVIDEERFDADPSRIFQALIDEGAGKTHWWAPAVEMRSTSGTSGEVGSTFDMKVSARPRAIRWSGRITERVDGRRLRAEFTSGDFVGEGIWTFDRIDGRTRVRYRFHVRPHGLVMRLTASFVDVARRHSEVMRGGFQALRGHLAQADTEERFRTHAEGERQSAGRSGGPTPASAAG